MRGRKYLGKDPLEQLSVGFYGPIQARSRLGKKIIFVAICDSSGYLFAKPLKDKAGAPQAIGEILDEIVLKEAVYEGQRIVLRVRSDSENTLRGKAWQEALHTRQVNDMHSTPYLPQQNGVVERMMRTLGEGLRAILQGVDRTVWDFAAEYFAYNWNRVPRRNYARLKWAKDLSPLGVRHARRKERRTERTKPGPVESGYRPMDVCEDEYGDLYREQRGRDEEVILQANDFHTEQCDELKHDFEDHDKRMNVRVYTNETIEREFIIHEDVHEDDATVAFSERPEICGKENVNFSVKKSGSKFMGMIHKLRRLGVLCYVYNQPDTLRPKLSSKYSKGIFLGYAEKTASYLVGTWRTKRGNEEFVQIESESVKFTNLLARDVDELKSTSNVVSVTVDDENGVESEEDDSLHDHHFQSSFEACHDDTFQGTTGSCNSQRPDQPREGQIPGHLEDDGVRFGYDEVLLCEVDDYSRRCAESGEQVESVEVMLSVKKACSGEEAPQWIEAISKERLKLEATKTWRACTDEELKQKKTVIPIALILSKKRDGAHKCRAVVLGNFSPKGDELQLYAPVVSMVAIRLMLTAAARSGDHLRVFDLDNAFLNAEIQGPDVFVSLPPVWRRANEVPVKKLLKALYGLPQSPKLWYDKYTEGLTKLGWEKCKHESGMWRKPSTTEEGWLKLAVYVDDNVLTGPDEQEVDFEVKKILDVFKGRVIEPEKRGNFLVWDILGSDLWYDREHFSLRMTMETYIDKIVEKFDVKRAEHKPMMTMKQDVPMVNEADEKLQDEAAPAVDNFNYREIVGSLMWCATVARPDIARPVNLLAKWNCKASTVYRVRALYKVLSYLKNTKQQGIGYHPDAERDYWVQYSLDGHGKPVKLSEFGLFSDASWASAVENQYSVSGMTMIVYGTPIAWRSKRQSVRADSSCMSEYIAAADAITWASSWGFLEFHIWKFRSREQALGGIPPETIHWMDSTAAIDVARAEEKRPKTRWMALRWWKVNERAKKYDTLKFCVSEKQKADCLTKTPTATGIASMLGKWGVFPL